MEKTQCQYIAGVGRTEEFLKMQGWTPDGGKWIPPEHRADLADVGFPLVDAVRATIGFVPEELKQ